MTEITHKDHFGSPIEIGREYVYVYFNRTSVGFRRVVVTGFAPMTVRVAYKRYGDRVANATVGGDKLFPVPTK